MIEEHKITAEEGAKLLSAMGDAEDGTASSGPARGPGGGKMAAHPCEEYRHGRSKASVQIAIGLVDAGMKIGAHFAPEVEGGGHV